MTKISWFLRLKTQRTSRAAIGQIGGVTGAALLLILMMAGNAIAQETAATPASSDPISAPFGYSLHQSIDLGGRVANTTGSHAMYSTLVNLRSGPRVLGETF